MVGLTKRLVVVDLWDFFTRGEHPLETEQVTVDTLTISSPGGVLHMTSGGLLEQHGAVGILLKRSVKTRSSCTAYSTYGLMRIQHGLGPCLTLITRSPDDLGPSKLVLPSLSTLVANTWSPEHLVEGELFYELGPSVRRRLELLDILLSVTLVV